MAHLTGLTSSTLQTAMWGKAAKLRVRTAGAIAAMHLMLERRKEDNQD